MTRDQILENSYRNYHGEGINYICLDRNPRFTLKLYFLPPSSEIVNPHDHRYSFSTMLLSGSVRELFYQVSPWDEEHFSWKEHPCYEWFWQTRSYRMITRRMWLKQDASREFSFGEWLLTSKAAVHTLHVREPSIILQYARPSEKETSRVFGEPIAMNSRKTKMYDHWEWKDIERSLRFAHTMTQAQGMRPV